MKLIHQIFIALFASLHFCGAIGQDFGQTNGQAATVSLMQLLVRGEDYEGKLIRVVGVVRLEYEGNALFLVKEHFDRRITDNAVWISLNYKEVGSVWSKLKSLNGRYVVVEGIFNSKAKGHFGAYRGAIQKVNLIAAVR